MITKQNNDEILKKKTLVSYTSTLMTTEQNIYNHKLFNYHYKSK